MMAFEMFRWWYGRGWSLMVKQASQRLSRLVDAFSVGILLRTLFAPWRRIISYPGAGLDAKLRAMLDNLVSRCVGFVVRLLVLLTVAILAVFQIVLGLLQVIVWPLVPVLIVVSLLKGIV